MHRDHMSRKTITPPKSIPAAGEEVTEDHHQFTAEILPMLEDLSDACLVAGPDGKLCFINGAARELFNLKGRITGRKLSLVLADRQALDLFEEAVRAGKTRKRSLSLTLSGEGSRTYLVSIVPLTAASGEKLLRIALQRQSLSMEPLNPASEDPRTQALQKLGDPLTIIQGYLENLLDGVIRDPVVMRQCLSAMQRQTTQIQRLLSGLSR